MVDIIEFYLNMNALLMAALVYAAALILMTQGFVLSYKTTRSPNFMLGQVATIGAFMASASVKLMGLPLSIGYLLSFVIGAILMALISLAIIEPLLRRKTSPVLITLATMGLGLVLEGKVQVYDKYIQNRFKTYFTRLMLKQYDFKVGNIQGVFIISTLLTMTFLILFRYMKKRTKVGLAMRAYLENMELAQIQGINIRRNRVLLWGLAGGMSSLAGGIMVMWFHMTPSSGSWMNTGIISAAILGGINSVNGAFIGGLVIGVSEIMLITGGQAYIGVWVGEYRALFPFIVMCLTLLLAPNGLFGSDLEEFRTRSKPISKVRQKTLVAALIWLVLSGAFIANISNRNKAQAREAALEELSFFEFEERAMNKTITEFKVGNFTTFKNTVERLNITQVYREPGSLKIYYIRHNAYWTLRIRLRRVGLWDWVPR